MNPARHSPRYRKRRYNLKKLVLIVLPLLLLLPLACDDEGAETAGETAGENGGEAGPVTILIVHSYHEGYAWVDDINDGFAARLDELKLVEGEDYTLEHFYMDTKRIAAEEYAAAGKSALEKVDELGADIVVAVDDNAQEYMVKELHGRDDVDVVFCGVNNDPVEKYGIVDTYEKPGGNVTGCLERERFVGTVALLREMVSGVASVAFVYDDGTTAPPVVERMKQSATELGVEVTYERSVGTLADWRAAVVEAAETADFIHLTVYHTIDDEAGEHVNENDVLAWTVENSPVPLTGTWDWSVEGGALCAEAINGINQGREAADLVQLIFNGREPATISIVENVDGERMINSETAAKLGIELTESLRASCTVF
ncbi:MAG: hypothetical protein GF403_00335 [Candidatus Coatesbacteria bacterium]|nr:hypothetical protein [Candidatus Coatesbacteria bacterium]